MENTQLIGFIGRDATVKVVNEKHVVNFSLACTKKFTDKSTGEIIESTNWYSVFKRFSNPPEKLLAYLKKGVQVYISGEPSYKVEPYNNKISLTVFINAKELDILSYLDNSTENETTEKQAEVS